MPPTALSTSSTFLRPLPWKRIEALPLIFIILVGLATVRQLWSPGIPSAADFLMGLYRVVELADAWRQGVYFLRLGLGLNFGYGAPLFQFYPPLASYLAFFFTWFGLGYIAAAKAVFTLTLILGGLGVYFYARRLFANFTAATVAGALYILSPYLLLVIYERGAMAEFLALALLPWLVWAAHSLLSHGRRGYFLATAALTACFILAHNITAFFVFPAVALYVVLLALIGRRPAALIPVALAFALGLGLAAFYWLPALAELGFSQADRNMLGAGLQVRDHLASFQQIVQWSLVHLYAGDQRFHFSLVQFVLALAGLIALIARRRERCYALWLLAAGWVAVLLLQSLPSAGLWENLPLARYIQFPWRLYGVGSFCAVLLGASLFTLRPLGGRVGMVAAGALIAVSFWLSTANLRPELLPIWYEIGEERISRSDMWERGRAGFPLFSDYAPRDLGIESQELSQSRTPADPGRLPPVALPSITVVAEDPLRMVLDVAAEQPWTLRLHRIFFPGWQVSVDGQPVETGPSGDIGLVTAQLPAGSHRVTADFGETPLRRAANLLSLVSLAIWLALLVPLPANALRRRWLVAGIAVVVLLALGALLWWLHGPGRSVRTPTPFPAHFAGDLRLLAFDLTDAQVCGDDPQSLRLYWAVGSAPTIDYKLFLHLAQLDDSGVVAQVDTQPFGGFNPMTRWEAGEVIVDEIPLRLDGETPPGRYLLLAGIYDPATVQNAPVLTAPAVLPGDRLKLSEVRCEPATP